MFSPGKGFCPSVQRGPQAVASSLCPSLPPRETLDFPRSWLLPVIRDHVRETRLGFFTTYFLPLATTLKSKGIEPFPVYQPEAPIV